MGIISSIYNSGYNIKRLFLGEQELKLAYLGEQIVFNEVIDDLNYVLYEFYKGKTISNTIEAPVKRAILKGNTKYRDIDTGDILDTFDETKNLELVSVQMPVLKTTGKNLFNGDIVGNYYVNVDGGLVPNSECYATDYIEIKPNTNFSINSSKSEITAFYDKDKNFITWVSSLIFSSPSNAKFLRTTIKPLSLLDTFQLEEGTITTEYEPYKTNILTVNEDVELRGIGEVKDELDLLTGELTQRIGEVVLDGSEDWQIDSDTNDYRLALALKHNGEMLKYTQSICDRYPTETGKQSDTTYNYVYIGSTSINLYENPSMTLEEFKSKLKQNPITFQYQFTTESVKTVDLTIVDQDGKTINKLNSFNGTTHVSTEVAENSIYPTIAIEVATE